MTLERLAPGHNILGGEIPEIRWIHGDDLCDCTFQRIGEWTNPYIARTMRVRLCCIWSELYKQYPEHVQEIGAYYDENEDRFETEPMEWNGESDMPPALWHRQLAVMRREPIEKIRHKFEGLEPPKGVKRPKPEPELSDQPVSIYEIAGRQAETIAQLQEHVSALGKLMAGLKSGEISLDEITVEDESEG